MINVFNIITKLTQRKNLYYHVYVYHKQPFHYNLLVRDSFLCFKLVNLSQNPGIRYMA